MTEMITIYCLIDPRNEEVFYVGRTGNYRERMYKHRSNTTSLKTPNKDHIMYLKSIGVAFSSEILDVVPKPEGKFWEEFYTTLFRSWGFQLKNNIHHKMGNQTSFKPGTNYKPIVGVSKKDGSLLRFNSTKQAKAALGKGVGIGQSIMKIKKAAAGHVWFLEEVYNNTPKEELDRIMEWATRSDRKANSGSFKKGLIPHNKKKVIP